MKILSKPDPTGRMIGWSLKLSEYVIRYEPRGTIKSQHLADFLVELSLEPNPIKDDSWTLHVDESSNTKGNGVGIVQEGYGDVLVEQSLHFDFKMTNNQAEYETLIAGLARDLRVERVVCKSDSQLTSWTHDMKISCQRPLDDAIYS